MRSKEGVSIRESPERIKEIVTLITSILGFASSLLGYLQNPQNWPVALAAILFLSAVMLIMYAHLFEKDKKQNIMNCALILIIVAIIFLAFVYVVYPEFKKPYIEITSPNDGSEVTQIQTISGISRNIPSTSEIWVVIYAHSPTNRYYPQRGPVIPNNGYWSIKDINIGDPNDIGYKFDIIALVVNEAGQNEFRGYFLEANKAGGFIGMENLPSGIIARDHVTVTRI